MNKKTLNIGIFLIIFGILYLVFQINNNRKKKANIEIILLIEDAYFQGQADAINGDIRIKEISDSTYVWIKSPWKDSKPLLDTLKRNK